jgi:hypothetical protein
LAVVAEMKISPTRNSSAPFDALSLSITAWTSSSPTLIVLSIFFDWSRRQAISPMICRRMDRIDEPRDCRYVAIWSGVCFTLPATRSTVLSTSDWVISISSALAAWICSVSSIRLLSTCCRTRSSSSAGMAVPLEIASRATRWSMSVWVITSPLTMALALTTDGNGAPNS